MHTQHPIRRRRRSRLAKVWKQCPVRKLPMFKNSGQQREPNPVTLRIAQTMLATTTPAQRLKTHPAPIEDAGFVRCSPDYTSFKDWCLDHTLRVRVRGDRSRARLACGSPTIVRLQSFVGRRKHRAARSLVLNHPSWAGLCTALLADEGPSRDPSGHRS